MSPAKGVSAAKAYRRGLNGGVQMGGTGFSSKATGELAKLEGNNGPNMGSSRKGLPADSHAAHRINALRYQAAACRQ